MSPPPQFFHGESSTQGAWQPSWVDSETFDRHLTRLETRVDIFGDQLSNFGSNIDTMGDMLDTMSDRINSFSIVLDTLSTQMTTLSTHMTTLTSSHEDSIRAFHIMNCTLLDMQRRDLACDNTIANL